MIDPIGMTVIQYADAVVLSIDNAYAFGKLSDPQQWQAWGVKFCSAPTFAARNPPNPFQFTDWQEWAMRMYPILETVGGGG